MSQSRTNTANGIGYASLSPNMDTSKFLDWIKLSPRYLTPFAVVSGFLLFAKEKWLEVLGLAEFVQKYRPYIGIILLLSVGLLASHLLNSVFGWISQRRNLSRKLKNGMKHLQTLTLEEKEILKTYIETGTRTQYLPMRSGL
jgi:Super-infection exclusion protein B